MRPQYKNGHFQWSVQLAQVVDACFASARYRDQYPDSPFFFFFCIGLFSIFFKDDLITNNKRTRVQVDKSIRLPWNSVLVFR